MSTQPVFASSSRGATPRGWQANDELTAVAAHFVLGLLSRVRSGVNLVKAFRGIKPCAAATPAGQRQHKIYSTGALTKSPPEPRDRRPMARRPQSKFVNLLSQGGTVSFADVCTELPNGLILSWGGAPPESLVPE